MNESSSQPNQGRSGTGQFARGWAAKIPEDVAKLPFYRRAWFRRSLFCFACVAGLTLAAGFWRLNELHRERAADFARSQLQVTVFASSDEFKAFAHAADAQLLAMLNYIVARPDQTGALLTDVAAWEKAHRTLPWTLQLSSLPVSSPPERMLAASREACTLLVARGFVFDDRQRTTARGLFVHVLSPYLAQFVRRHSEYDLAPVLTERRLQEQLMVAYAGHFAPPAATGDIERLFALYAVIGPDMWRTIDRLQKPAAP